MKSQVKVCNLILNAVTPNLISRRNLAMKQEEIDKTKELAEEHWEFLESWLHKIFVDGFTHGYKHAKENEK